MNETHSLIMTGMCPYCHAPLDYTASDSVIDCPVCHHVFPTQQFTPYGVACLTSDRHSADDYPSDATPPSPHAALMLLDEYAERCEHEELPSTDLTWPIMDAMAARCRVLYAGEPSTCVLLFRVTALPLMQRVRALAALAERIAIARGEGRAEAALTAFDRYVAIATAITDAREAKLAYLQRIRQQAEELGAGADVLTDLDESLTLLRQELESVHAPAGLASLPAVVQHQRRTDADCAASLRDDGIDAEAVYQQATELINRGIEEAEALPLLRSLRGYRDADALFALVNRTLTFRNELFIAGGRRYLMQQDAPATFHVKSPMTDNADTATTYSLYELTAGKPATTPTLSGIRKLLKVFGNRIFFLRADGALCVFDADSEDLLGSTLALTGSGSQDILLDDEHPLLCSSDGLRFYLRKKLHTAEEKRGCRLRRRRQEQDFRSENNYEVLAIDMAAVTCKPIIPAVIDIMDHYENCLFYTVMTADGRTEFCSYDTTTGAFTAVLNEACQIHTVTEGRVLYSFWDPDPSNANLYVYEMHTQRNLLLEKNVHTFCRVQAGRVLYTVSDAAGEHLISLCLDGTDRRELPVAPDSIRFFHGEGLYYHVEDGQNSLLMRREPDGGRTVVARRFRRQVLLADAILYYLDTQDELHATNLITHEDTLLATHVAADTVIIGDDGIYTLRYDAPADRAGEDGTATPLLSLYHTDRAGQGLCKLTYNVRELRAFSDDTFYYVAEREVLYRISTPTGKDGYEYSEQLRRVSRYYAYHRDSGESELVLTVGAPDESPIAFRTGCRGRKQLMRSPIVEAVEQRKYFHRTGKAGRGDVLAEDQQRRRQQEEERQAAKQQKKDAKRKKKQEKAAARAAKKQARREKKKGAADGNHA